MRKFTVFTFSVTLGIVAIARANAQSATTRLQPDSCFEKVPAPKVSLARGDSARREVRSYEERNFTGILVDSAAVYRFVATGHWQDGSIEPATAGGFGLEKVPWYGKPLMAIGQLVRRSRADRWFVLMGEVSSRPGDFFAIGDSLPTWRAPASGELIAFANDVKHFYKKNNKGCVTMKVVRVE